MAKLISSTTEADIVPSNMAWDKSEYIGKDGLSTANGKVEFMSANGLDAWHNLGQVVEGAATLEEAMHYSGLDQWIVEKKPLYYRINDSEYDIAPETYGLFRSDNQVMLGTCGPRMIPRQPLDHFRFLDTLVQSEDSAKFDTAGALKDGKIIFCSINLGSFALFDEDKTNSYVAGLLSYDGTLAMQYFLTTVRIVCSNTAKRALKNQGSVIKVRQTKNAEARLEVAKEFFADAMTDMNTFRDTMDKFSKYALSQDVYNALMKEMIPNDSTRAENIKNSITDLYYQDVLYTKSLAGNSYKGSAFNLYNAAMEYVDHHRAVHGEDKEVSRATSALVGSGSDFKDTVYDLIYDKVYA